MVLHYFKIYLYLVKLKSKYTHLYSYICITTQYAHNIMLITHSFCCKIFMLVDVSELLNILKSLRVSMIDYAFMFDLL